MPRIIDYSAQQGVLPQGRLTTQASAADMGAAVGQALEGFGAATARVSEQVFAVEEERAKADAQAAASNLHLDMAEEYQRATTDPEFAKKYGEYGDNFTGSILGRLGERASAVRGQLNPQAQKYFDRQTRELYNNYNQQGRAFQLRTATATTIDKIGQSVDNDRKIVAADPSQFESVVRRAEQAWKEAPYLTPEQRKKGWEDTRTQIAAAAVASKIDNGGAKALVDGAKKATGQTYAVPDLKADTVKPYTAKRITEVASTVEAPSEYDVIFKSAGAKYGVDWRELKMRSVIESGLNPAAVGPQTPNGQSLGIMQFEKSFAAKLGIDPTNPEQAIDAAAKLLAGYQKKAGGDMAQVDMMYYGGEGRKNWGANTKQYAANMAAARAVVNGQGLPPAPVITEGVVTTGDAAFDTLDYATQQKMLAAAESQITKDQQKARGNLEADLMDAKASMATAGVYDGLDTKFNRQRFVDAYGDEQGPREYAKFQEEKRGILAKQSAVTQSWAQQDATLIALQPGEPGTVGYAERQKAYELTAKAVKETREDWKKDPANMAYAQKMVGPVFDPQDNRLSPELLRSRAYTMKQLTAARPGTPFRVFSEAEAAAMREQMDKLSANETLTYFNTFKGAFNDNEMLRVAVQQIYPDSPVRVVAANIYGRQNSVEVGGAEMRPSAIAATILEGEQILNKTKLDKREDGKSGRLPLPSEGGITGFAQVFAREVGNAFAGPDAALSAKKYDETYQAARAYYVATAAREGTLGQDQGVVDSNRLRTAIQAVTGGQFDFNGKATLAPYGMPEDRFRELAAQKLVDAQQKAGIARNLARNAKLYSAGENKYFVGMGAGYVTDKLGAPLVIEINE